MPKFFILLLGYFWFSLSSIQAQCLAEKDLFKRLKYYNNNPNLPPKEILEELEPYLAIINDCPYKNDSTHILLLRRIAVEYSNMDDYLNAVLYERKAIGIINSDINKPSIIPEDLVNIYYFLSIFYDSLNNTREKRAAMDSCISIGMRLKCYSNPAFIQMLAKVVQSYYDIGDYHRCIEDATLCEKLAAGYFGSTNRDDREFGIGLASHSLGWHVKALLELNEYEEAENLIANKLEQYQKAGLIDYLSLIYAQKAEIEEHKGNYQNALLFLNKSLSYDQKTGDYFNCKQTLKNIGYQIYFEHLNDGDGALVYFRKALAYTGMDKSEKKKDAIESLDIFANIANVYVQKAVFDSAFWYFQLAFDQIKPGTNETDILHSPAEKLIEIKKIHYLTNLMIGKGDAYLQKYLRTKDNNELVKSIHIYKVTDSLFDRIKLEQIETESKLYWRKNSRRMYENAINACYFSGDTDDAFYFFEKSRAVILNDLLTEQNRESDKDIIELSQARKDVLYLERKIQTSDSSSVTASKLQKELFDKRYNLDNLQENVKRRNPLYYQSFIDSNNTTLSDMGKKILKDHQALLEIYEGESAVYSLFITQQHIYLNKIDKNDFDNFARLYNLFLSNADLLNRKLVEFTNAAYHLYEMIFKNSIVPKGRIIISPDGAYFPFEALVTNYTNPRSPVYFLQDHSVTYTYSAHYLMNDFAGKENKSNGSVLGIAPVHFPYAVSLDPLLGSDLSLDQVESYFKDAHSLVEGKASRNNFLQQFSKYSVIQLYTHASDTSDRKEPVIYFSDSSLYLSELIQENKPSTQLIVLSACNTGNGKFYQGEGIFSFNRAFAAVGIPASVINLWSIDSKSTYKLTELFYRYLSAGMTTDKALQSAKLEFIRTSDKQQTLPYYWAAAILVGKTEAIDFHQRLSFKTWTILVIIIIFFFIVWWLWKRRKSFLINRRLDDQEFRKFQTID
ncbi:MAG TPA: CHAT domain-containing tetratricopeptide repeat protein [Puia sp.]|jgi:CHAT domain-containing protein|nr:CHAT domain-containing tetratricopeptide repeat protein [Puia sp.]